MLSPILNSTDKTNAARKPPGTEAKRNRRGGRSADPGFCRQWRSDLLIRTIETQVLPKLALAHRADVAVGHGRAMDAAELETFLALVLANDPAACIARVDQLAARGLGLTEICLTVLAPAARRLGEMWDDDLCSFADVTAGLGTLRSVLYRLHEICEPDLPSRDGARRVLLASLAADGHSFGLQVVSEVFCHAGWDVTVAIAAGEDELIAAVRGRWFAVAGLSIGRAEQTAALGRTDTGHPPGVVQSGDWRSAGRGGVDPLARSGAARRGGCERGRCAAGCVQGGGSATADGPGAGRGCRWSGLVRRPRISASGG